MRLRLPKPLHGWRVLAGEVAIIVLGVLIALAAQGFVDDIRERREVARLRDALRAELADDRARLEDMQALDRCANARLDAIERWLATTPSGQHLPGAFNLFLWNLHSGAWDMARDSSVVAAIPLEERLIYAGAYDAMDNWRSVISDERETVDELNGLLGAANDPDSRRQIAAKLGKERSKLVRRSRIYAYFFQSFDELGIKAKRDSLNIVPDRNALCKPLQA